MDRPSPPARRFSPTRVAAFDCLVEEVIERHSHAIVLGAVVSVREGADEPALAHWRGGFSASR